MAALCVVNLSIIAISAMISPAAYDSLSVEQQVRILHHQAKVRDLKTD